MAKKKRPSRPPAAPAKKRGRGRPSVFENPIIERRFFQGIALGMKTKAALRYAPIDDSTFYRHLAKDPELAARIDVAKAEAQIRHLKNVEVDAFGIQLKNGKGWKKHPNVETSKWVLKHLDPDTWGDKSTVGIKNADPDQPFRVSARIENMSDEQIERELAATLPGGDAEKP